MGQDKTNLARAVLVVLCTSLGWVFQPENTDRNNFLLFHCFLLMVTTQIKGSIAHHGGGGGRDSRCHKTYYQHPTRVRQLGSEQRGSDSDHVMACKKKNHNKNRQPKYVLIIQASDNDSN